MKLSSLFSVLLITLVGSATAQECPDLGVIVVPERLIAGPSTPCGIGLEITIGGVSYTSQQGFCPSFILIMPKHGDPAQARVGYYYLEGRPKRVWKQDYECYGWIWTACRMLADKPLTDVTNYVDVPCGHKPPTSAPQTSAPQGS